MTHDTTATLIGEVHELRVENEALKGKAPPTRVEQPRIFQMRPDTPRSLALMAPSSIPDRFGCIYIQFPERGEPSGGSSWSWPGSCFREPEAPDELLWAHLYLTAKRVRDLKAALAEAESDAAAVRRYASLIKAGAA